MGFAEGLRAGTALVDSILQEQRQAAQDKRTEEEFGWKRSAQAEIEAQRGRVNRWWQDQQDPAAPAPAVPQAGLVLPPQTGPFDAGDATDALQGAAGMRAGAAQGLSTQPVGAPKPAVPVSAGQEAGALAGTATAPTVAQQAAPAAGTAPTAGGTSGQVMPPIAPPQAPQLGADRLAARQMQSYGRAVHDPNIYFQGVQKEKEAIQSELATKVMQMPEAEIEARSNALNTNVSNHPLLYNGVKTDDAGKPVLGKDGKPVYEYKLTGADGKPGKTLALSGPQRRELVLADELAKAGYGAEAMAKLTGVSKELGDAIAQTNVATHQAGQLNLTAKHYDTQAEYYKGMVEYHKAAVKAMGDRAMQEKFSNGKYFTDANGNVYVSVFGNKGKAEVYQIGGEGVVAGDMKNITALPKGAKPFDTGRATGADKPVPPAGTNQKRADGSLYQPDGTGGEYDLDAVIPQERESKLKAAGWSRADAANAQWSPDGKSINIGGKAVPWNTKGLYQMYKDAGVAQRRLDEATRAAANYDPNRPTPRPYADLPSWYLGGGAGAMATSAMPDYMVDDDSYVPTNPMEGLPTPRR